MSRKIRCWDGSDLFVDYHDYEWGRPVHDDIKLFEMLTLEIMQAGLSWITVLNKREAFRKALDGFNPVEIVRYNDKKIDELMNNEKIIRNRLKILATINNAGRFLDTIKKYGSFDKFIWAYVDNSPIIGHQEADEGWMSTSPLSDKISKDLKKAGFKFVGSTTVYSFMQATGIVNDHLPACFVYKELLNNKGD